MAIYPKRIIQTTGRPAIAIFEDYKPSLAMTKSVYTMWSRDVKNEHVSKDEWDEATKRHPVDADLGAERGIRAFVVEGEPGCLVVPYRSGKKIRHYIDQPSWLQAVGLTKLKRVTRDELEREAPIRDRGPDFHTSHRPDEPDCRTVCGFVDELVWVYPPGEWVYSQEWQCWTECR